MKRKKLSSILPNIMKTDPKWLTTSKSHLIPILTLTNSTLKWPFPNSLPNINLCAKKENSWKKWPLLPQEWPTSEFKVRIWFSTTWRVKVRDFKWCAISTTTRDFKLSAKFIPSSEEGTLSAWLANQGEQREENCQSLRERFSCCLHACTCYLRLMWVSRTHKLDTERDIWTW